MVKTKRRRLPRQQRVKLIVATAAEMFAEKGFSASTRELAARLEVTQALLYRYFPSKDQLIDEVFDSLYVDRWEPDWGEMLCDRSRPLVERLSEFYQRYLGRGDSLSLRLFIRANLDGMDFAGRYRFPLTERVLGPIIGEMRYELDLPPLTERAMLAEERELALILHGGLVFSRIREHIYRAPVTADLAQLVEMHVQVFLPGAGTRVSELHASSC